MEQEKFAEEFAEEEVKTKRKFLNFGFGLWKLREKFKTFKIGHRAEWIERPGT